MRMMPCAAPSAMYIWGERRKCQALLVQRAAQNNSNVNSEPNSWLVKNLQYVLSTVELFLFSSCSLGYYGGLTSWFYYLSESLAVGCVQHSLLHLTPPNTYVVKAQPCCPPRPPSPKKKPCPDVV